MWFCQQEKSKEFTIFDVLQLIKFIIASCADILALIMS